MCICEFIVAIVGVTAGHINPVTQAVNLPAQKVLIAFVCMYVFSFFLLSVFVILHAYFLFIFVVRMSFHRYIAFFAISWGPVVWVITGEIFVSVSSHLVNFFSSYSPKINLKQPLAIRAKGMSLSVASSWLCNFGISYATPYLVNASTTGIHGVKAANLGVKMFFIWGATCFGCFIFT